MLGCKLQNPAHSAGIIGLGIGKRNDSLESPPNAFFVPVIRRHIRFLVEITGVHVMNRHEVATQGARQYLTAVNGVAIELERYFPFGPAVVTKPHFQTSSFAGAPQRSR